MEKISAKDISQGKLRINEVLMKGEGKQLLVVGDLGLDEYVSGDVKRISPEAPVPVVEVKRQEFHLGLAANVAQNLHSLGGKSILVGVVGDDDSSKKLRNLLRETHVSDTNLIVDNKRPTTHKVRVMSGQHHIVRIDHEARKHLDHAVNERILQQVEDSLLQCAGLIIQDYGKGMMSESLCQGLIDLAHRKNRKVIIDPHRTTPVKFYRGADFIKPNRDEAYILSGLNIDDLHLTPDTTQNVGRAILEQTQCGTLIITQGSEGVLIFEGSRVISVPTAPRQVFDVTGAGDTFLSAFSLAIFSGFDLITASITANFAAGVVVGKVGSVPCSKEELIAAAQTFSV